jgi:hypothetical protein
MMCALRAVAFAAIVVACCACSQTGRHELSVPLYAVGRAPAAFDARGWTVELDDARVGMGPIYFCAGASSSPDLCPSSVAELAGSVTIDALDPARVRVGDLNALNVGVRAVAWDYAITWPRTAPEPVVLDAAPEGHSAHFEGTAAKAGQQIAFVADIDLLPQLRGTRALEGIRSRAAITDTTECELDFDAQSWWSQVDFDDLSSDGTAVVEIKPTTRAYEALYGAMSSTSPPTIVWSNR